jgi:hypothetical protein
MIKGIEFWSCVGVESNRSYGRRGATHNQSEHDKRLQIQIIVQGVVDSSDPSQLCKAKNRAYLSYHSCYGL